MPTGFAEVWSAAQLFIRNDHFRPLTVVDHPGFRSGFPAGSGPWSLRHVDYIHDLDLMCSTEEDKRGAIATVEIQPGQVGAAHQHHRGFVPVLSLGFRFLPHGTKPSTGRHELGDLGIRVGDCICARLLRLPWSTQIRWACRVRAKGSVGQ